MISYMHFNANCPVKGTVAMELPTKNYFTTVFVTHSTQAQLNIGYTALHPKDNYSKKKGREESSQKLKPTTVNLVNVEIRGTKHVFHFKGKVSHPKYGELNFWFGLSTIAESDNVHFVYGQML